MSVPVASLRSMPSVLSCWRGSSRSLRRALRLAEFPPLNADPAVSFLNVLNDPGSRH